jgi:hypothetical protein
MSSAPRGGIETNIYLLGLIGSDEARLYIKHAFTADGFLMSCVEINYFSQ